MYTARGTQNMGRKLGKLVELAFDDVPNSKQVSDFASETFGLITTAAGLGYSKEQRVAAIANVGKGFMDQLTETIFKLPE